MEGEGANWRGKVQISENLSKHPFSKGSGRITLKNCLQEYFHT